MPEPEEFRDQERIMYAAKWATNEELALTWENREQNRAIVSVCNVNYASCQDSLYVKEDKGWLDLKEPPIFSGSANRFTMALSVDNYTHVNIIDRESNQRLPLTSGKMVVTKMYHWDEDEHIIYFQGTYANLPGQRHLYAVTDFDSANPGVVTCLSCDVVNTRGIRCLHNTFHFSADKSYYVMSCDGPDVPQDYLFRSPNQRLAILNDNSEVSAAVATKILPTRLNLVHILY